MPVITTIVAGALVFQLMFDHDNGLHQRAHLVAGRDI